MMSENYILVRGMPGSGKSTTIVGLMRLLARLGASVLLVAYTNSAVDTVLCKLKGNIFSIWSVITQKFVIHIRFFSS